MVLILPGVAATNPSTLPLRKMMAKKFHIQTIVFPHHPKHFSLSENTNIVEMIVVLRRWKQLSDKSLPTQVVNVLKTPSTVHDARVLAEEIRNDQLTQGAIVEWPHEQIQQGDWSAVQFYSPYLLSLFKDIREGRIIDVRRLDGIAKVHSSYREVREFFQKKPNCGSSRSSGIVAS